MPPPTTRYRRAPVRRPARRLSAALAGALFAVAGGCGAAAHPTGAGGASRGRVAPATSTTDAARRPTGAPPGASRPTAKPTTTGGPPFTVTKLVLPLVDTSRPTVANGVVLSAHRALTTEVWVPEAPGRRPLVVFGPGFQVGPDTYQALLEGWASHGYVVAAPEFPLTDAAVAGPHLDEQDIVNQPADLRFVTDALVSAGSPVAGRIDVDRVAVAGHSDGAESALAASIARPAPGQPPFRAVIAMSVQPLPGATSLPNPPILVTQGDADTINPPSYGYRTWSEAASPKYLEVLHGGGHLPPLEPGSPWLPAVSAVTEAFLDAYAAGDGTPRAIIAAGNVPPLATVRTG